MCGRCMGARVMHTSTNLGACSGATSRVGGGGPNHLPWLL